MPVTQASAVVAAVASLVDGVADLTGRVDRWDVGGIKPTLFPAAAVISAGISYGNNPQRVNSARYLPELAVVVRVWVEHQIADDARTTDEIMHELVGDVCDALLADRLLSGAAHEDLEIAEVEFYDEASMDLPETVAEAEIRLRVPFSHAKSDTRVGAGD